MPKIETYTTQSNVITSQSSAADFVDTRGMEKLAGAFGDISDTLFKLDEDEQRLKAAKILAESKQQWMLDMEKRRQMAEETGNYTGFTDGFRESYKKWADETVGKISNRRVREDFGVNLTEMGTQFLGSAISYEAQKRGEAIKKNYSDVINYKLQEIATARTADDINIAGEIDPSIEALPASLFEEAKNTISSAKHRKKISMANKPELVRLSVDDIKLDTDIDEQTRTDLLQYGMQALEQTEADQLRASDEYYKVSYEAAKAGKLTPETESLFNQTVLSFEEGTPARLEAERRLDHIKKTNDLAKLALIGKPEDVEKIGSVLQEKISSAKDPLEAAILNEQLSTLYEVRANRNDLLAKDFAGTSIFYSDYISEKYKSYSELSQNADSPDEVRSAFSDYAKHLDAYATIIGYSGKVKYIPQEQVDFMVNDIRLATQKENGVKEITDRIDSYEQTYGNRFSAVMDQISEGDANTSLRALSIIPSITPNMHGVADSNKLRADVISAVVNSEDPNFGKVAKTVDTNIQGTVNEVVSEYTEAFNASGMGGDLSRKMTAFDLLYKNYLDKGVSTSDAKKMAEKAVFGSIDTYRNIVYPVSVDIRSAYAGSVEILKTSKFLLPEGAMGYDEKEIRKDPMSYIDFITHPSGDGLMPVWKTMHGQPVLGTDKKPMKFSFVDGEIASKRKSTVSPPLTRLR